jgi:hypothetical protein
VTSEAREKFERWHARQYELGACRCPECKGKRDRAVAAFVAPDDVAERGSVEREAEAATPAPFDPEGVRRTFTVDSVLRAVEQATDAEIEAVIGPPAPGEPDQRPYRGEDCSWFLVAQPGSALDAWNEKIRRAKAGGLYGPDEKHPKRHDPRLDDPGFVAIRQCQEKIAQLTAERDALAERARHDTHGERRARIGYEEARARLEAEFGKEAVGQAIDKLTKLVSFRDDVDRLTERAIEMKDRLEAAWDDADEMSAAAQALKAKLDAEE